MYKTFEMELAGRTLRVDVGRVAKQANGAVLMHYGDTTAVSYTHLEQRGRQQKEHRADVRKETKDRTEMKEQKDQTETTTEITAAATDAAVEETDVVIVRKEEADRDSREATVRRMAVPTEIRETAITDMTTTVVMTDVYKRQGLSRTRANGNISYLSNPCLLYTSRCV